MESIVVTGSTGMTGIALIEKAVARGIRVLAFVRPGSSRRSQLPDSELIKVVEYPLGDLQGMDADAVRSHIGTGRSVFYHLGWGPTDRKGRLDPALQAVNIGWSLGAVSLASELGCSAFIGAGSQAEYGIHRTPLTSPDTPAEPNTAYGISKYAAGRLCSVAADNAGIDYAWIRIFSLYGAHEAPETMIQSLLPKMMANEACDLTEGAQQWDYLNVEDAAEAFLRVGLALDGTKVYCLGSGESRTIREYVTEMRDAIGSESELRFGAIPYEFGVPNGMCADITTLVEDTGWHPTISFEEGIRRMIGR